jgi:cytochrome c oxidase assembly factor 1
MPWIWGEMNQLHGRINVRCEVKGTKASGTMRFSNSRPTRRGAWETSEWSLETKSEGTIDLLDAEDPLRGVDLDSDENQVPSYSPTVSA